MHTQWCNSLENNHTVNWSSIWKMLSSYQITYCCSPEDCSCLCYVWIFEGTKILRCFVIVVYSYILSLWYSSLLKKSEDSVLLGCDSLLLGVWFLTCQRAFLWHVRNYSPNNIASHPGRIRSSTVWLWILQILPKWRFNSTHFESV